MELKGKKVVFTEFLRVIFRIKNLKMDLDFGPIFPYCLFDFKVIVKQYKYDNLIINPEPKPNYFLYHMTDSSYAIHQINLDVLE